MTTIDPTVLAHVVGAAGGGGGGGQFSLGHIQQAMSGKAGAPVMDVPSALPPSPHRADQTSNLS